MRHSTLYLISLVLVFMAAYAVKDNNLPGATLACVGAIVISIHAVGYHIASMLGKK